jgi:hypothetical protein
LPVHPGAAASATSSSSSDDESDELKSISDGPKPEKSESSSESNVKSAIVDREIKQYSDVKNTKIFLQVILFTLISSFIE